ncbi:hypothetical protein H7I87_00360 [Mycobacterium timonense]|uniref:Uncharacterized protein n=1 Tax=Mycobacterium bouchedurhonense TaxID=701041 RepID=A0AAW5S1U8_MYCBC|nr:MULTISPECIES: hypothetical protein [Mycobacterium avium complex (MAC)]MCV6988671.1 hypothetical protein [Mycobacterium bouchedurhonense]MCV6993219.1 hypothetical protein [Mycobacterium timonense]MDV3306419.1 hypothetical protein [Mycobacterium avium subsp. hominissuis]ORA45533.1 hypothetical protein BST19_20170 [Mycobacterium bouchedurhonense]
MANIGNWLDTFVEEKELDREHLFEVEGPSGLNVIPLGVVVDTIKISPPLEQAAILKRLQQLDFCNGDVTDYLRQLAGALVI